MTRRMRRTALVLTLAAVSMSGSAVLAGEHALGAGSGDPGAVTKTVTAERIHRTDGADEVVLSKRVTVKVSTTRNLRDRQSIDVTWSGAEPTRGIIADSNSGKATQQEYPVVLLQCRGSAAQVQPSTCWAPTATERYQYDYGNAFPAWRVDRFAAAADREQYAGEPNPRPAKCPSPPQAEHWLPFQAADGTDYYGGANNCAGLPPDAAGNDGTLGLPSNATYAATGLDGTGSAQFNVRDAIDNASLGCSDKVACALVIIPIVGISCDVAAEGLPAADRPAVGDEADAAAAQCRKSGAFQPGQIISNPQNTEDLAVSGALWWSASNWRNRVTVPLSFAPPANVCDLSNKNVPALVYGSELMIQATTQWAPTFCLSGKSTPIKHVQTGEPQSRNLLGTKSIEAALVSDPPDEPYRTPTVHAPVAVTGFAISYVIDDAKRDPYTQLKLTPRLLAKLMTESYPAVGPIQQGYDALSHNPLNLSLDPEFIALNPGIKQGVVASISASSLFSVASDSDVIRALTAYVNADPEARAWLDGTPDPWGMTVNPNYKAIPLPTDSWPLLDTYVPKDWYQPGINDCLHDAPVPYLPLVASPTSRLANVALSMQFAIANSQTECLQPFAGTTAGQKLVALGRQTKGFRFMVGLTSLADAQRFGLPTAALESQSTVPANAKFNDASGRTFVAPSTASLLQAATMFPRDAKTKSWPVAYDAMRTTTRGAKAYPGTMLVYADIPARGLSRADASAYAQFLTFAAGPGQVPGTDTGQLPAGYAPMTAQNGLAHLVDATVAAAGEVAAQNAGAQAVTQPRHTTAPPGRNTSGPLTGSPTALTGEGQQATSPATSSPPAAAQPSSTSSTAAPVQAAPVAKTIGQQSSTATVVLIVLLVLMVLGPITAPATLFLARRRSRS